ncbi:hypothetical protein PoB_005769000 [Plakobranchus ocellatus]|uniref:Uncharacterized protein n=1 Tax=Plakobranchus ocellatus TaxID=259542 RepID=A0AAV4CHZ8_9GAST|nr:hypothetical protein PoB_005769000 [Plakobranchus ocellatus]
MWVGICVKASTSLHGDEDDDYDEDDEDDDDDDERGDEGDDDDDEYTDDRITDGLVALWPGQPHPDQCREESVRPDQVKPG